MSQYRITTQDQLDILNEEWFNKNPDDRHRKWSGCNYYKNDGTYPQEPLGTAQSMHDCTGCERFTNCTIKMDTPIWFWDKEIDTQLKDKWKSMLNQSNNDHLSDDDDSS